MRILAIAALVAAAGCQLDFDCKLGELEGTWRWSYSETNGNCGPIADETARVGAPQSGDGGCVVYSQGTSDDQCRMELDFECPTADDLGSQRWVIVADQVAPDRISATGTVNLEHRDGSCRSTYDIAIERL